MHGFTGGPSDWNWFASQLRGTGASVATFDYQSANTQWVTDAAIAPRLASEIVCLANASTAAGGLGKVVIVAHSMGGLASKLASQVNLDGRTVGDRIAGVLTIGTPYAGSWLANAGQFLSGGSVPGVGWLEREVGLWIHSQCGHLAFLADMCRFLTGINSPASQAMQIGSSALAALPAWPSGVPVLNVAGDIHLRTRIFFGPTIDLAGLGDGVVGAASAEAQPNGTSPGGTRKITCNVDVGANIVEDISKAFVAGGCFHTALIKSSSTSEQIAAGFVKQFTVGELVPVVACPTTQSEPGTERLPTQQPARAALAGLGSLKFATTARGRAEVLAPSSWSCEGSEAEDGGATLSATPNRGEAEDSLGYGIYIDVEPVCAFCIYTIACSVFPTSELSDFSSFASSCIPADSQVTTHRLGERIIEFDTSADVPPPGFDIPGLSNSLGAVVFNHDYGDYDMGQVIGAAQFTCVYRSSDREMCDAARKDFEARYAK